MGLIKHFSQSPGIGWQTKELLLAGFKHADNDTKFILEVLSLANRYKIEDITYLLDVIEQLYLSIPLTPLEDPSYTSEYIMHNHDVYQSTRLKSLFSKDKINWYDIDKTSFKIKFYRFIHKYICKLKSNKLLYFVRFPYDPN